MANKVIKNKCKNWCSECKAFDWAHCIEKYEVEKPIENVQTALKELWISESQSKERLIGDTLVVELSVSLEKVAFDDIKYISESHVEKLLTEKDNALRLASEKILEALNETISVESDYKLYRERTTGHINTLNNQIEELRKEITQLKCLHLEFYNGEDNLLRCRYCEKIANEI